MQPEILEYKVKFYPKPYQLFIGPPPPSVTNTGLCLVRTRLFEPASNQVVAEVITLKKLYLGKGLLEAKNPDYLLKELAAMIAKEVAKMM